MTRLMTAGDATIPADERADPEGTVADALSFIVQHARDLVAAKRVWLYGSRAAGRARRHSDIDVAVEVAPDKRNSWSYLAVMVREDAPTLLSIDLVDIEQCGGDLHTEILKTGVLIYEQP